MNANGRYDLHELLRQYAAEKLGAGETSAAADRHLAYFVRLAAEAEPPEPLPPVESLTPESDFTPFMRPGVDPATKRAALRVLVRDPRFNVMDGLDVYIDDYTKPDPLPEGWLEKLNQVAHLGHYQPPLPEAEGAVAATRAGDGLILVGAPADRTLVSTRYTA